MRNFTIYGKDGCVFCQKAVDLLTAKGFEFDYKKIVTEPEDNGVKAELLARYPEATKVPQIFEGETHVGGYDKLVPYLNQA